MFETLFPLLFRYIAPGLIGLVALVHILKPVVIWKLGRMNARSQGIVTDDEPDPGGLTVIRVRGVFFLAVAIVFAVFSHAFFDNFGS